uniref:Uncharacterized protein n=1 Tax=Anguilla anguilla TaxID=7936 RepID=A0A0E9TG99_ANGAN
MHCMLVHTGPCYLKEFRKHWGALLWNTACLICLS